MNTACPDCKASLVTRKWMTEGIFVEVYACGAIRAWGQIDSDQGSIRPCERPTTEAPQNNELAQELIKALQHVLRSGVAENPSWDLQWAEYHLKRAVQGWPEEWRTAPLFQEFESFAARHQRSYSRQTKVNLQRLDGRVERRKGQLTVHYCGQCNQAIRRDYSFPVERPSGTRKGSERPNGGDRLMRPEQHIYAALDLIYEHGGTGGAHHKQWLLDQLVRTLAEDYDAWVKAYEASDDGPNTYTWDKGIAP